MTSKRLITITAVAVAVAAPGTTALARGGDPFTARTPAVKWTSDQLQDLANAYALKNPDWHPPLSVRVHSSANATWTAENLDRLANAYALLNPGWTRPSVGASAARATRIRR